MNVALTASITTLPVQLCKTATWDRGKELSGDAHFKSDVGTKVFFADPRSPSQRPSNENTNGLLRQCFQKGTDLSRLSADDLKAVAHTLNYRPRRVLGWKTQQKYSKNNCTHCNDKLNSPSSGPSHPAKRWLNPASSRLWDRAGIHSITRWLRR